MKILITGATGTVGNYVVQEALKEGHEVVATGTDVYLKEDVFEWVNKVKYFSSSLWEFYQSPHAADLYKKKFGCIVHLAWRGLPNYLSMQQTKDVCEHMIFLEQIIKNHTKNINIIGTCYEYGMQNGQLNEETLTSPCTSYGLAKDSLRKYMEQLNKTEDFDLKWIRLFYLSGAKGILSKLQEAIDRGDKTFDMSGGEQLRDYMDIKEVAKNIVKISTQTKVKGIINCCSGKPISIRRLVEEYVEKKKSKIKLDFGKLPYIDYEPMAFWGDRSKLDTII